MYIIQDIQLSHHGMKVEYAYDGKGRKVKTKLNGKEVLWNTYTDHFDGSYTDPFNEDMEVSFQGSYTNSTTLDGLFTESFVDEDGKQVLTKYSGDDSFGAAQTLYDEKERVSVVCSQMTDRDTNQTYQEKIVNTYDDFDEIVKQEKKINGVSEVILETHYDENHRWIVSSDVILSQEDYRLNTMNTYNDDHQVTEIQIREGIIGEEAEDSFVPVSETTLSYDVLGRVIHQNLHANKIDICHEYSYLQQDENSLDLIAEDITKIKIQNGNQTTYLTETMRYEYDVNGNIVTMESDENKTRYVYDALNRLIREDNPLLNQSIVYKYDQAGNLLLKKTYAYTLEEKLYAPEVKEYIYDCDHRDQLISFDGKSIAYDSMGRPTTYKDDEFEWNNQGQLTYIVKENGDAIEYLYDTNGIRRKKIVNGNETSYLTHGSQILSMKHGVATFVFRYVLNKLVGFHYNNGSQCKEYLYQRNIQGDIIGIFDDDGNQVGGYAYDAYGNHVITIDEGGIATLNPFRYRGYYWDEESHLYYLNSRYYDPETGRFISPDDISYLDPETICGLNLYAYCSNNPVNYYDPDGHWAMPNWLKWVIGGVIIIGLGIATLATGGAAAGVAGFIVAGAFKGAVIGAISGALVSETIGGISSVISGNDFWSGFLDGAADGFMSGAIIGGITGAISSGVQVANAAKMWQAGTSARTSTPFKTMQHHYQTHVINEGFAKGNNIVKYTKDAINFANRNASVLKFQVSYNFGLQPFWPWINKIGMNGQFTSAGKILTFWYVAL